MISDDTVATDPLFKTSCNLKILLKRNVRVNIGMNIGTVNIYDIYDIYDIKYTNRK